MSEQNIDELVRQLDFAQLEIKRLTQKLSEAELRQTLIAKLLSTNNQNQSVIDYFNTVNNDFVTFVKEADFLEDEAIMLLELQEIGEELKIISSYPEFYKKHAVAIAGGFSAGKSEFISSLFNNPQVRLPIGIEPTTAIPTYAFNGSENGLLGCSKNGGTINLLQIDENFQSKLSHQFIRSFGFNLKKIMPFVFLITPMPFEHLCLIDTPGYNPSDIAGGHTSEDMKTASEFIHNADALLWLIGLDSNGTIPKSDLDFLEQVQQEAARPLYIILNKADLRPFDDLQDIMYEIIDTLDDYDIEIQGICVYSSINKTEFFHHKQSLHEFLQRLNVLADNHTVLLRRLYAIDEKCQHSILRSIKENKQVNSALSGLKLDLLQQGFDDLGSEIYEKINKINALYTNQKKEVQLKNLESIIEKLVCAINAVFGNISNLQRKTWTLEDVELGEKFLRLTQKDELPNDLHDNLGGLENKLAEEVVVKSQNTLREFWQSKSVPKNIADALTSLCNMGKYHFWFEDYIAVAEINSRQAARDIADLLSFGVIEEIKSDSLVGQGIISYKLAKPKKYF